MTDVPETRWARTVDGACIAYQDLGEGPVTLARRPRLGLAPRGLLGAAALRPLPAASVAEHARPRLRQARHRHVGPREPARPDLGVLLDDVRAVMDAAGVEKAALLGWGGPGPELAAFFAATYPERTVCFALFGRSPLPARSLTTRGARPRRTSRAIWPGSSRRGGATPERSEFVRWGYGSLRWGPTVAPTSPPTTTRSSSGGTRSSHATRRRRRATRPSSACGSGPTCARSCAPISVPTAVLLHAGRRPDDERLARAAGEPDPGARAVPVATTSEVIWVPDPEPIVAAIERFIASVRQEEAELDRMLATVLFTDIVGSTDKACAARRRRLDGAARAHNTSRSRLPRQVPRQRDQDDRRRLPRHLRRARPGGEVRPGDLRGGQAPRHRGARRLPHRRDRAAGRRRRRHRRAHRRPRRRRSPDPPRSSSRRRSRTSWPAPAWRSTTAASTT